MCKMWQTCDVEKRRARTRWRAAPEQHDPNQRERVAAAGSPLSSSLGRQACLTRVSVHVRSQATVCQLCWLT